MQAFAFLDRTVGGSGAGVAKCKKVKFLASKPFVQPATNTIYSQRDYCNLSAHRAASKTKRIQSSEPLEVWRCMGGYGGGERVYQSHYNTTVCHLTVHDCIYSIALYDFICFVEVTTRMKGME